MRLEHPARARGDKVVAIIGAGFAGLNAARRLANAPGMHVVLIDQRNHHLFQPLLYEVATAGLNAADIAVPIRAQFKDARNIDVHLGRVDGVDLERGVVVGGPHELVLRLPDSRLRRSSRLLRASPSGRSSRRV